VPVFVKGALLWASDAHAAQGNGEINLTGIETAFRELNITVDVIKGRSLEWPRVETPTHWLTLGYDEDLNKALEILKSETSKFITEERRVPAGGRPAHHDAALGLPHLRGRRHREGHVLLQSEGRKGEAPGGAAEQGNGDRLRHRRQQRRSQQGDGCRFDGHDQPDLREAAAGSTRCLRFGERRHGLPYRAANRQRSRRSLPDAEKPVTRAGPQAVIDGRHDLEEQVPTGREVQ